MRTRTSSLFIAALLGSVMLMTAPAHAQYQDNGTIRARIFFNTRVHPRWESVPGTRVSIIREDERPDFDTFRYGNTYYVYDGGNWYRASRLNDRFTVIDARDVPEDLSRVPRDRWHNYPSTWESAQPTTMHRHHRRWWRHHHDDRDNNSNNSHY